MTEGKRLKQIRKMLNLSQAKFGAVLGVSKQYISNVENGCSPVSKEILYKLSNEYEVSSDYILHSIGAPFIVNKSNLKNYLMENFEKLLKSAGIY